MIFGNTTISPLLLASQKIGRFMTRSDSKYTAISKPTALLTTFTTAIFAITLSASPIAAARIGVTAAVNQDARGTAPGRAPRILSLGSNLVFNERIETKDSGLVQVLLVDGTTFTVGPNSVLIIDEFVYEPNTGTAKLVATVTKGAFRFIGGRASRNKGGVTIHTPTGTIGIRGGMVDGLVNGDGGKTLFSMVFGTEVNYEGNDGNSARIYRSGYTLDINGSNGGTKVRRRTLGDSGTFQSALAGRSGASGGAVKKPTNTTVVNSPIVEVNSGAPESITTPTPRPSTVLSTSIETAEEEVAGIDVATQEIVVTVVEETNTETIIEPEETKTVIPTGMLSRVLTSPFLFIHSFNGDQLNNNGPRSLVGGTPETNRVISFASVNGRLIGTTNAGDINLPDFTGTAGDTTTTAFNVNDGTSPMGNLTGTAFAGRGDFVAYMLGINGDATDPFYVFYGTETNIPQLIDFDSGTDIRQYELTRDPNQNLPVPYLNGELYGAVTSFNSTNLFVVEPNQSTSNEVEIFSTWIDINGSGASQKSAVHVLADAFYTDSSGAERFWASRRGSYRINANAPSIAMRGGLGTTPGAGGTHLFGTNAEHFVVGQVLIENDTYFDGAAGPGLFNYTGNFTGFTDDGYSGTLHVASLVSETPQTSFTRTSRQIYGFMVGMNEQAFAPTGGTPRSNNPFVVSGAGVPNFSMYTNAINNSFGAQGVVTDVKNIEPDVENMLLTFGAWNGVSGGNTFVDDNVFGGVHNRAKSNTQIGYASTTANQINNTSAGSYIVSGKAAPLAGYQHCTSCTFADWGWWGTRVRANDPGSTPTTYGNRSEHVHLGTWVAGDIPSPADMPLTGSAIYNGTALGTVARNLGTSGIQQYVAKGDMALNWNFNSRTGNLSISNVDGMNVAGPVTDTSSLTQSLFGGTLTGTGLTGSAAGAFVNNGAVKAKGVIGQFEFSNGNAIRAAGTIVGTK